jgi:hypothetical protein
VTPESHKLGDLSDVRSLDEPPAPPPPPALTPEEVQARVLDLIGPEPQEQDFGGDFIAFERARTAYELDKRATTREVRSGGLAEALVLPEGTPRSKLSAKEIADAVEKITAARGPWPA